MRLGVVVGEHDPWQFFKDIFDDLASHYEVSLFGVRHPRLPIFHERVNRRLLQYDLEAFMRKQDVVFFEWASGLLAFASHLPKRCPVVVTRLHSYELYEWAPKINWRSVDKVILVSQVMQERFGELYPGHRDKTAVVYNGVSLSKFQLGLGSAFRFNLGMVCRINPLKRVYEIVLAVYELRKDGYPAHLHIAGEPTDDLRYPVAVKRLVEKLNLKDSVHFYGNVSDVNTWLQQIDVFISNSYWEGHQVALLEAMASGCYCLSHFWDGAEEILPADNLYVTELELRQKIIDYFDLPETSKHGLRMKMWNIVADRFDLEYQKVQIRHIIDEAIAT